MNPLIKVGGYHYRVGPNQLGIGIDNLAFADYNIAIDEPIYGPRYNVQRSLSPFLGGAQFPLAKSGPQIDLRANGVYMANEMFLAGLTQLSTKPGNG